MTPQPQHPQRCETCNNKLCEFHPKQKSISYMGSPISDIIHDFVKNHGCASHSSAGAQQQRIEQVISILKWIDVRGLSTGASDKISEALALLQAGDHHE